MEKEKWRLSAWQWRTTIKTLHVLLQKAKFYQKIAKIKYSTIRIDYFVCTCLGGFDAEKVSGMMGTCSTFLSSRCARQRIFPLEISFSKYCDRSLVPWYWKPNVSRAWKGWILLFIQSNMTTSLVICFCLRLAIHSSRTGIWLSSTVFLFNSGLWIGGPGVIIGSVLPRLSIYNHFGFQSITLLDSL